MKYNQMHWVEKTQGTATRRQRQTCRKNANANVKAINSVALFKPSVASLSAPNLGLKVTITSSADVYELNNTFCRPSTASSTARACIQPQMDYDLFPAFRFYPTFAHPSVGRRAHAHVPARRPITRGTVRPARHVPLMTFVNRPPANTAAAECGAR